MISFLEIVLALTDVALLAVFVAGILFAMMRIHVRRRASKLVILALSMLIIAKLATFSLAFWARSYSAAAMASIVAYVKMGNIALTIFAVAALVTAVYAEDEPCYASRPGQWDEDMEARLPQPAMQSNAPSADHQNPFRAPAN